MDQLFNVDWGKVFAPDTSLLEIFVRGTVTYLVLFTLLRFVGKRESGTLGIPDLLVLVLIADAAQNAMAGSYNSITDGLFLVATIIFWSYILDWLGYHVPFFERLLRPPPLRLVAAGQMQRRNMRRELITTEELLSTLRQQGVEDISEVKEAFIEGDGHISVVTYEKGTDKHSEPEHQGV